MGLSKESPLSITVDAGCKALPALNSIRQVVKIQLPLVCLSKTFQILLNCDLMYNMSRVKMHPTVNYDGAPKHDKMCSKPYSVNSQTDVAYSISQN